MAIQIKATPVNYASINDNLVYVAYEGTKAADPVTYVDYKYVADVYISGVMKARLKVYPDPVTLMGVFNIDKIARTFLNEIILGINAIDFAAYSAGALDYYIPVVIKFGEEYGGTLYTDLTVDTSRNYYNHYNVMNTAFDTQLRNFNGRVTNGPLTRYLTFGRVSLVPYFFQTADTYVCTVKTYNATGALIATHTANYVVTDANSIYVFDFGANGIGVLTGGSGITGSTAYYTVQIGAGADTFTMVHYCEGRYSVNNITSPYLIHFINQFGGFETLEFPKVSRKTYDIERHTYIQKDYRVDGAGSVNRSNPNGNVMYGSVKTYASLFTPKMKLTTEILSDEQYRWLRELVYSPVVYFEDQNGEGDGYRIPVQIEATNYEEVKFVNDKITCLQIDINFGKQLNTQFQ